jgi:PAS domain S-box-containing protein
MSRGQILVLEDETHAADQIQTTLQLSGYAPAVASSPQEAIEKARTLRPDLVLVDSVPESREDPTPTISAIRAHLDVPIVFLMPYGDESALEKAVQRARSIEPEGFLLKPYREKELVQTLETVLHEHVIMRKRAQAHRHWLAIAETTPDLIATTDVEGNILYLNCAARRILGIAQDQALPAMHIADVHPTWANVIVLGEGIETAILDGVWRGEAALLTREGSEIPVSEAILAHAGPDGACQFLSFVARDISELKATENTLCQSERFYRSIVETSGTGIWVIDPENRVAFANPKMAKLLGYTAEEMLHQPLATFVELGERTATAEIETPPHGIKDQRNFKLRRRDGTEFWATLATSPLYDTEERYTGVLGMVTEMAESH